ncbi:ribonuclease D [Dysgonomonadaceae bacterium PH5-43]|nr:ribonuclease D [Dysgonomonadaceae bacterium PH5-43]
MERTITKEELNKFTIEEFNGTITEVDTINSAEKAIDYLYQFKCLGFDTETRPSFKKGKVNGVALIQLATENTCILFRLNKIGFIPGLEKLLSDPNITKVGLSLRDDFHTLRRTVNFEPQGFIDLQSIAKEYNIADTSLQKIYAILFNKKISKNQRLSNWEADVLTEPQKAYAALDAWACLKIYNELNSQNKEKKHENN